MHFLLSPFTWLVFAVMGAALASVCRCKALRWLVVALAVAGLVGAMPLGANLLLGPLERDAPVTATCSAGIPPLIVVFAGGSDRRAHGPDDYAVLTLASLRRTVAAVALWRQAPGRRLVIAGGPAFYGAPADSVLMRNFAAALGVPAESIITETTSANTWENAHNVAKLVAPGEVALVTSAMHMPRAAFALRQAGFSVCPFSTDRRYEAFGLPGYLLPQAGAAIKTEQALHEWVGMAYYHWLAWRASATAASAK